MSPAHPEQAVIQVALQRGYLNQGQVQAALQAQAQYRQRGQETSLLQLLRGALQPPHVQELSEVYRQASEAYTLATSAATIKLPPGAVNQALSHSHASFAPTAPGAVNQTVSHGKVPPPKSPGQALSHSHASFAPTGPGAPAADPYASSPGPRPAQTAVQAAPPAQIAAQAASATQARQAPQAPPATLGRFEIQREIARGGMGVVYVGRDPNLDRQVAIKCLLPGGTVHPEQVERFRREGLAVARLKHPNIVQVYEVAEHQGAWYMVMDLVTGGSLQDKLKREGPLEPLDAARTVRDLARATACAHEHNVLHRDIKPHNVLLDEHGTAKLTDFGLAKLEDVPSADPAPAAKQDHTSFQAVEVGLQGGASLTRGGQILGTPGYLPPEQAMGAKAKIDTRSDIYSLGATLFALLAGRPAFTGDTILKVLQQLLNQPAPPVSELREGVDPELERIVARCLEREPEERYPSATELADALEAWIEAQATGQSTSKRRKLGPTASQSSRRGANPMASSSRRRQPNPRAGASARNLKAGASGRHERGSNAPLVIGAVAVALTGGGLFLLLGKKSPPPPVSPTPTGSQVAASPTPAFQDTPRYNDPPPPPPEDPDWDRDPPPEDPPASPPPEESPPDLPPADEPPPSPPAGANAGALLADAERLVREGREREALELLDRAIELSPEEAELYFERAQVNGRLAEYFDAYSDASQALDLRPDWPKPLLVRGMAAVELGRLDEARRDFERVVSLRPNGPLGKAARAELEKLGSATPPPSPPRANPAGGEDRAAANRLVNEAIAAASAGRGSEAVAKSRAAVDAAPGLFFALAIRGQMRARYEGDVQGGLADTTRAIELGPEYPIGYATRAEIRANSGDRAGALADLRQARPLAERQNPAMLPQLDGMIAQLEGAR